MTTTDQNSTGGATVVVAAPRRAGRAGLPNRIRTAVVLTIASIAGLAMFF